MDGSRCGRDGCEVESVKEEEEEEVLQQWGALSICSIRQRSQARDIIRLQVTNAAG